MWIIYNCISWKLLLIKIWNNPHLGKCTGDQLLSSDVNFGGTIFPGQDEQWNFLFNHLGSWDFFLINWTWISHFTKGNKNTSHTNGTHTHTHTHQKTELSQTLQQGWPIQSPKQTLSNTNGPWRQIHVRTSWQNTQKTFSVHKGSSMADTHQNQLAKHPNSSLRSKEKLAGYTPMDWLGLGARRLAQKRLSVPSRKSIVGNQCRAGEKQGGSLKQMV